MGSHVFSWVLAFTDGDRAWCLDGGRSDGVLRVGVESRTRQKTGLRLLGFGLKDALLVRVLCGDWNCIVWHDLIMLDIDNYI